MLLVTTPFSRAVNGPSLFDEFAFAQGLDDFVEGGALNGQALREGKKRVVGALSGGVQDHELCVRELGCWRLGLGHGCLHDRRRPDAGASTA